MLQHFSRAFASMRKAGATLVEKTVRSRFGPMHAKLLSASRRTQTVSLVLKPLKVKSSQEERTNVFALSKLREELLSWRNSLTFLLLSPAQSTFSMETFSLVFVMDPS